MMQWYLFYCLIFPVTCSFVDNYWLFRSFNPITMGGLFSFLAVPGNNSAHFRRFGKLISH